MIFALGEIWLSLLLALLLGFFLAWLLWKWRRHSVARSEWDDLNGELRARRRALSQLEHEQSVLLASRNAAEAQHVRMQATIDDLQARADLLPAIEARLEQSEARQAQPTQLFSQIGQNSPGTSHDIQAEARRAAAMATGSLPTDPAIIEPNNTAPFERANERVDQLAAELDASTTAVEELEAERQQLTAESEERHRRVRQLEEELLSANARAAKAQEIADQAREEARQAKEAYRPALASATSSAPVEDVQAKRAAQAAQAELKSARQDVADSRARLERAETKLEVTQNDLDSARAELAARTEQAATLQLELRRRGGELERRVLEQNRLDVTVQQLQREKAEISSQLAVADGQLTKVTAERDQSLRDQEALAGYPKQVEELQLANQNAATRIDDLTHELEGVAQELDGAHDRIAELSAEADAARQRIREASERESALSAQARDQRSANAAELIAQREQISTLEQSLAAASEQSDAMRHRLLEASQRAEELGRNQMRLKALEARVAHLSASEADLLELRRRQPDLERRASRADTLEGDIVGQRQAIAELTSQLEEAQQRALRVVELEGKLRASDLEREQLRTQMKRTEQQTQAPQPASSSLLSPPPTFSDESAQNEGAEVAELQQRAQLVPQLETRIFDLEGELAEARESAAKTTDGKHAKPKPDRKKIDAAKAQAKVTAKENDGLKKSLAKSERALKDSRNELRKLRKSEDAKLVELESALKHLRRDADQNAATIAALRRDLVKARSAKAGHREKRLRSAEEKVAQLEAVSSKQRSTTGSSKSKTAEKPADDLKLINGIGPRLERTLNNFGITRFEQLAAMKRSDIDKLQKKLSRFPGRIERDNWVGQARSLVKKGT